MQDVHPIGTAAGRALADRRHTHHTAAALKCPRCESTNTKFCYYNNYNRSQPRHFCKNCRRYWTNGGVLRNVPVGGGSRKSAKRSKPKLKISAASTTTNSSEANGVVLDHNASTEARQVEEASLAPEIGGFVGVMRNSGSNSNSKPSTGLLGFNGSVAEAAASFSELLSTEEWEMMSGGQEEDKVQGLPGGIGLDPTVRIEDLLQSRGSNGGVVALDWQANDQNGFGLGLIDDQSYWSQATTSFDDHNLQQQWSDNHNNASNNDNLSLFLP